MRRPLVVLSASAFVLGGAASVGAGCSGSTPQEAVDPLGPPDASIVEAGNGLALDGALEGGTCVPRTCAQTGANCGPVADGCGGLIECGTCSAPESCGGGGTPSVCGTPPCTPKTCADLDASCGPQGDGCGGVIDCGTCAAPETCGGGGVPSRCGVFDTGPGCIPRTCADQGFSCGPAADGCGGLLDCGTCEAPATCGGGGKPGVCGAPTCKKTTCEKAGATCGPIGDGCGGKIASCGTCTAPDICGGGGVPSRCGGGSTDAATCVGLECDKPKGAGGATTSISGVVRDPAGKVPLYGVQVYVPNTTPAPFVDGATCDRCADALSGSPIAYAVTDTEGRFTIEDVPAGANVPLVIQSGKWRRQITVPTVTPCVDNPIADANRTRLPRNKSEGDIPKIALTTGAADPLECLLRKIGIDDAEFTSSSGTGRVHLYAGSGGASRFAGGGGNLASATTLWGSLASLKKYDVVLFACEGEQDLSTKPASARQALVDYTAIGGRVFATHWHNVWIQQGPAPWPSTATWNFAEDLANTVVAEVDQTFPKGKALADWLVRVGASSTLGELSIRAGQHTVDAVNASSAIAWITAKDVKDQLGKNVPSAVQYYTFNTPIGAGADAQCGRVVFTDIHVSSSDSTAKAFPSGCTTTELSAQEKALEFMLFDLTSKICDDKAPGPPPPTCEPRTCQEASVECGPAADGCGKLLDCGDCEAPEICGGGGVPGKCGKPTCKPRSCKDQGLECGPAGDGCGKTLDCGTCAPPDTCGGGGEPGKCGHVDAGTCVPLDCSGRCGPQSDGCGGLLSCPPCDGGSCTKTTCEAQSAECGAAPDGCGGLLSCGECVPPATCGGGGVANRCGTIK